MTDGALIWIVGGAVASVAGVFIALAAVILTRDEDDR